MRCVINKSTLLAWTSQHKSSLGAQIHWVKEPKSTAPSKIRVYWLYSKLFVVVSSHYRLAPCPWVGAGSWEALVTNNTATASKTYLNWKSENRFCKIPINNWRLLTNISGKMSSPQVLGQLPLLPLSVPVVPSDWMMSAFLRQVYPKCEPIYYRP
jgi:hypothetical protein